MLPKGYVGMSDARIRYARMADVSMLLMNEHYDCIKVTGQCIYLRDYPHVYTKIGYCGYVDYHTNETGNSIDLLTKYLHYSFLDAVRALCKYPVITMPRTSIPSEKIKQRTNEPASLQNPGMEQSAPTFTHSPDAKQTEIYLQPANTRKPKQEVRRCNPNFKIPAAVNAPYNQVYWYLQKRCIPRHLIDDLVRKGLLFQDSSYQNIVFLSRAKDFCELHGTRISSKSAKSFHGLQRLYPAAFWSYRNSEQPVEIAYICEGALDAVSLYLIHASAGINRPAAYIGIGGVCNQQTITRISAAVRTIIAVDRDAAGDQCRARNPELEAILPVFKDWNEDLMLSIGPDPAPERIASYMKLSGSSGAFSLDEEKIHNPCQAI